MLTRILISIFTKERQKEIRQGHRGNDNVGIEAETGMIWPQAQECCPPHDEKNKKWILWLSLEEVLSYWYLDLNFWALEMRENVFLLFQAIEFVTIYYSIYRKLACPTFAIWKFLFQYSETKVEPWIQWNGCIKKKLLNMWIWVRINGANNSWSFFKRNTN